MRVTVPNSLNGHFMYVYNSEKSVIKIFRMTSEQNSIHNQFETATSSFFPKHIICVMTVSSILQPSHASIEQWIYSFCREKQTKTRPRALPFNRQTDTDRSYVMKLVLFLYCLKTWTWIHMKKVHYPTQCPDFILLQFYSYRYLRRNAERLLNRSFLVDNKMF